MKRLYALAIIIPALMLVSAGCSEDEPADPILPATGADITTCAGCHGDKETLEAVADPLPPPPEGEGGCGGTLPPLTAAERVFVGGKYGEAFLTSAHGTMACVACHGGLEPADDKDLAHGSADFVHYPSRDAAKNCAGCHPSISGLDATNLHVQGWGQKYMVGLRAGYPVSPPEDIYDQFPDQLKAGYDEYCGKCHSSCGECHVIRPEQAGGGFIAAHEFRKTPDMRFQCTACHAARVGYSYFGDAPGIKPDVHYPKHCVTCHKAAELHGDGTVYTARYAVPRLPKCEDCHGDKKTSNSYHDIHWDNISCQSCHAQAYNNCGSCHVGTGPRIGPYVGFKMGINYLPEFKRQKFVTVRQTVAAPDTWSNYGIADYPNFAAAPTFKFATPHSIQRWTKRTEVEEGESCSASCHIKDGANKEWYLFKSDLTEAWELPANEVVVVDGKLPAGWE